MSRLKILSPKLSSLKNAKNEMNEMNEIIPFLEFCLNADNRPSAVVASRINVVMFSINPSSSEMLFPAS
jgi:hypothetical protein